MSNRVIHSTFDDVAQIKLVRPPKAGSLWQGVPHGTLLTQLEKSFTLHKPRLVNGDYILSRGGADLLGVIPLGKMYGNVQDFIGVVSSNAGRKALEFYVGAYVCDTTVVSYQYGGIARFPSWEYVHGLKLDDVCDEAASIYYLNRWTVEAGISELENTPIDNSTAKAILFEAGVRGYTSFSRIGFIWKWWKFRGGKNAIDLLSAFNACWVCSRPTQRLEILRKFSELTTNFKRVKV